MTVRPLTENPTTETPTTDDRLVERVEQALAEYLALRRADTEAVGAVFGEAVDALAGFVLRGGKRVRPTFAWWGWRAGGGPADGPAAERAVRAVAALELLQASALIHDDLMDDSATRRGHPTVHVAHAARHREHGWGGAAERYGLAAAVLIGDLALVWADDLVAEAGLPEPVWRRSRPVWTAMRTELVGGQLLDVTGQMTGDRTPETALRVDRFKTAAYTVERPLQFGAALAGAPEPLVGALRAFGADVGVAFQLRDDLLGVFGDPAVTGKPAGDDLREGKCTLLVALALATARERRDGAASAVLESALGNPHLDAAGVDRARAVLVELGAPAEVERRIERLTESGLAALAGAGVAEPAATRLPELARAATRRRA